MDDQTPRTNCTVTQFAGYANVTPDADKGRSPCPRVREIIQRRMWENRQRLDELNALQTRMEDAVQQWSAMPDGMPDGHSICHLIESLHA